MIAYWLREFFEVDYDFVGSLNLTGGNLQMYQAMAVPMGESTIRKGETLTSQETKDAMQQARQTPRVRPAEKKQKVKGEQK